MRSWCRRQEAHEVLTPLKWAAQGQGILQSYEFDNGFDFIYISTRPNGYAVGAMCYLRSTVAQCKLFWSRLFIQSLKHATGDENSGCRLVLLVILEELPVLVC